MFKISKEEKPKNYSLRASVAAALETVFIIALFMLVTTGLPLIVPSVPFQVLIYGVVFLALFIYKGLS